MGLLGSLTTCSFPGGEAKYNSEGASGVVNCEYFFFFKADIYRRVFHMKNICI